MIITQKDSFSLEEIDYNSFVNIRPRDNNTKNEIQSEEIKKNIKN